MYQLITEKVVNKRLERLYRNEHGTETKTTHIYTDKDGGKWFAFNDLYRIPMIRIAMAKNITDLFTIGMTLKDIQTWCNTEKELLKGNDPEMKEKLYALVLEKERVATTTGDPIKQHLAVCTVYVMRDEERIDYFTEAEAEEKLKLWMPFPDMVAFFLNWHTDHIQRYIKSLDKISTTVLNLQTQISRKAGQSKG